MSELANKPARNEHGQLVKGHSGNPSGRPKIPPEVVELLRLQTVPMLQRLIDIAENGKKAMNVNGMIAYVDDDALRASVSQYLFERVVGKTPQTVEIDPGDGSAPAVVGIVFLPTGAKP